MTVSQKITELAELTNVSDSDVVAVVDDPSGAAVTRKAQKKNIRGVPQTSAESTAGVTPTNFQYEPGTVLRYGTAGDTALQVAIDAVGVSGKVTVSPGNYEQVDITDSDRTFIIERGAVFTIADSTIVAMDTSAAACLKVSGNRINFEGKLYIDGNKANQNTSGFGAGERSASLWVEGDDVTFGDIDIADAFWVGLLMEGGTTSGTETLRTNAGKIKIKDPEQVSALLWSCAQFDIESITVEATSAVDHRVRTGRASSGTAQCTDGHIGSIITPTNFIIMEKLTDGVKIDHIRAMGWKTEENADIQIGTMDLRDMDSSAGISFFINAAARINIGSVQIRDHAGLATIAGEIGGIGAKDIYIGSYRCVGALGTADGLQIRSGVRVHIGTLTCRNNGGKGLFVDEDASYTQSDIYIGSIFCDGNTGTDVEWQGGIENSGWGYVARKAGSTYGGIAGVARSYPHGVTAQCQIDPAGGTPTFTKDYNIDTVVEDVAGQYTVNFDLSINVPIFSIIADGTPEIEIDAQDGDSCQFTCRNSAGTATRPTAIFFTATQADQDGL